MFGSKILDVAIGLIFVYIIVSVLCTAVREGLEAFLKTRAAYLEHGIRLLLQDPSGSKIVKNVFDHPLVDGLFMGSYKPRSEAGAANRPMTGGNLPSYIPSKSFAMALLDVAARGPADGSAARYGTPISLEVIRRNVARNIPNNSRIQRVVLHAVDAAQGDLDKAQKAIEEWYDSAMDRVSGAYKRTTHFIVLVIGLLIAVGMNVDSVAIVDKLYKSDAIRDAVVSAASNTADRYNKDTNPDRNAAAAKALGKDGKANPANDNPAYEQAKTALDDLHLPVGWDKATLSCSPPASFNEWLKIFLFPWVGWILTALAASLGAPFWFDVLNKVMVIRSTVKPHEKSPEESSEDRQKPAGSGTTVVVSPGGGMPPAAPGGGGGAAAPGGGGTPPDDDADGCDVLQTGALNLTDDSQLPAPQGGVA
jgi:hypothetical protein